MFKFFRHIRQNLLTENKTGKYLKYAVGEIILVVIGILIALSINNWNTNRLNQKKEVSILYELKAEYSGKLNELNQKVQMRNMMISASSRLLRYIKEDDFSILEDSLFILTALTTISPTFDASNSVTQDLLNSGNLYLIENKELRKYLLDWTGELAKLDEEEVNVVHVLINQYVPYLSEKIPHNSIVSTFLEENTEVWQYIMKNPNNSGYTISKSNKKVDIVSLLTDLKFESYLSTINFGCLVANMQSENLKDHIDRVTDLINDELKSKSNE